MQPDLSWPAIESMHLCQSKNAREKSVVNNVVKCTGKALRWGLITWKVQFLAILC